MPTLSKTSICNLSLTELGEETVTAVTRTNKAQRLLLDNWDLARVSVLEEGLWDFAMTRAVLAADPEAPAFGYSFRYRLPADCIRVVDIHDGRLACWTVERGWLLTDDPGPLNLIYVRDETDTTLFSGLFGQGLGYRLAEMTAMEITQSLSKQEAAGEKAETAISKARLKTNQQNSPRELDVDVLLRSRF